MNRNVIMVVLVLLCRFSSEAQFNLDFRMENFSGWDLTIGKQYKQESTSAIREFEQDLYTPVNIYGIEPFTIIYPPGHPRGTRLEDIYACRRLLRVPTGYDYTVRVGPPVPYKGYGSPYGYKASYTFTVTDQTPIFINKFAFVQEMDHGLDAPVSDFTYGPGGAGSNALMGVEVRLTGTNTQLGGSCGNYRLYPGVAADISWFEWIKCGQNHATPWMTDVIDLRPYIGREVTIDYFTMDCYTGQHAAYSYIAPKIWPKDTTAYFCAGSTAVLDAPTGFKTYEWRQVKGGSYTQTKINGAIIGEDLTGHNQLFFSDARDGDEFICKFTSYSGCSAEVHYTLIADSITTGFTFKDETCRRFSFSGDAYVNRGTVNGFIWDFGDPDSGESNTSTLSNPAHNFSKPGIYQVSLTAFSSVGCEAVATAIITVPDTEQFLTPAFNFTDNACRSIVFEDISATTQGVIVGWEWDFGDQESGERNISTEKNPKHLFSKPGSFDVLLTAKMEEGCVASIKKTINVTPDSSYLKAQLKYDFDNCSEAVFTDLSTSRKGAISSWKWEFGDGTTSTLQHPVHQYTPGEYRLKLSVSSEEGCLHTAEVPLTLEPPSFTYNVNSICLGDSIRMEVTDGNAATVKWVLQNDNTMVDFAGMYAAYKPSVTGSYKLMVTGTNAFGCSYTQETIVNVLPPVRAMFSFSPDPAFSQSPVKFQNQTTGGVAPSHLWYFPGEMPLNVFHPEYTFMQRGSYPVKLVVKDVLEGCMDSITHIVQVEHPGDTLHLPNTFTPNGDGVNDTWKIGFIERHIAAEVEIFNRSGQLVFRSIGYRKEWDGKQNGKELPAGTYYYVIDLKDGSRKRSGFVDIIR